MSTPASSAEQQEQQQQLSPRTQAALQYLRRLRPSDGYAIERYLSSGGKVQVRLNRRNVPVSDEDFVEIVVDRSVGHVVGIQVTTSRGEAGRGIVLVDKNGRPRGSSSGDTVTVRMADASTTSAARGGGPSSTPSASGSRRTNIGSRSSSSASATGVAAASPLSDADNELLVKYGLMALGGLIALKIIFAAVNVLSILLLPLLYVYACTNCPTTESFDAKRELKRVMRGAHLPEERQPKGFFEQGLNRLAASVTAELATSLGYEISVTDFAGAARMAAVKVPVADAEFYWMGIFGKWRYVGQREIAGSKND